MDEQIFSCAFMSKDGSGTRDMYRIRVRRGLGEVFGEVHSGPSIMNIEQRHQGKRQRGIWNRGTRDVTLLVEARRMHISENGKYKGDVKLYISEQAESCCSPASPCQQGFVTKMAANSDAGSKNH